MLLLTVQQEHGEIADERRCYEWVNLQSYLYQEQRKKGTSNKLQPKKTKKKKVEKEKKNKKTMKIGSFSVFFLVCKNHFESFFFLF